MEFELGKFLQTFTESPSYEHIHVLRKSDLIQLAKHYHIEDVKPTLRKSEIKRLVVEFLVDEGTLPDSAINELEKKVAPDPIELRQLELDYQLRLREIELKNELEFRELEARVRLKELEVKSTHSDTSENTFDISKQVRLVPPFQENEVDKYFAHFEKVAQSLKWPSNMWTLLLQSVLSGKAQQVYSALSIEQSSNYDIVKKSILKAYELVPEAYRQKFRDCRKQDIHTYVEFARQKEILFDQWCSSNEVDDFEKLRQLVLVEEFKRCLHSDIKVHLDEQKVATLQNAAVLADDFSLTHKGSFTKYTTSKSKDDSPLFDKAGSSSSHINKKSATKHSDKSEDLNIGDQTKKLHVLTCAYCKKRGHLISDCWHLQKKNKLQTPNALVTISSTTDDTLSNCTPHIQTTKPNDKCNSYLPFTSKGFVSLCDDSTLYPITILRDTGASQSLLLEGILPISNRSSTNTSVLIQGIEGGFINVPLHKVYLESDIISGQVIVGLRPSLPVSGISLLLGNDIAGDKVITNPLMINNPSIHENIDDNTDILYPSCAITRAMKKNRSQMMTDQCKENDIYDLSNTFFTHTHDTNVIQNGTTNTELLDVSLLNKDSLLTQQEKDPELSVLSKSALTESEAHNVPICYYLKSGILMRKWRPPEVPSNHEWKVFHQIVVPTCYRAHILKLAHDCPMSGHLGVNKTYHRILQHYYWPGIRKSVAHYCTSCSTCQIVGKPNQKIPAAPLKPIPAFNEPFSRVLIDCVGPLPKTKSGNQYILTIMCTSTRFPEAIPVRNITSRIIIKALVKFFTFVGLPKVVQSDQGSNFMSGVFQQIMFQLGIKQVKSSAYHPESQGALERFHQTMKTMMKTYCQQYEKDWDEGLPFLMFAIREVIQESLGFSPFELVFGHEVRGPLKLVKEQWLSEDSNMNLLNYVSDFRDRLYNTCKIAQANLKRSQAEMKTWYDRQTVLRSFKPGDKVLVLFPIMGKPLQAQYHGPYIIDSQVSDRNYIIRTPDRRKKTQLCHVNMLKEYHERDEQNTATVMSCQNVEQKPVTHKFECPMV